ANAKNIEVINSKTLCGPHRYLVNKALELVKEGKTKEEIVKIIYDLIETAKSFLIPNDFDYLVRGGRLSPLVGRIGSAIKLVPVMTITEDGKRLTKFTTKRTFSKAISKICDALIKEEVDSSYKIYVCHACNEVLANEAIEIIKENIKDADIESFLLTPAFTTQGGPGCVSVQYIKKLD
ncbi:MAG: DegV family protein, partial [Clostridium sp.]